MSMRMAWFRLWLAGMVLCSAGRVLGAELAPYYLDEGTDYRSFAVGGLRDVNCGAFDVQGVSGPVSKAILVWHGATTATSVGGVPGLMDVVFGGVEFPYGGVLAGVAGGNGWPDPSSATYVADVTSAFSLWAGPGGSLPFVIPPISGVRPQGASLLVFFDDGDTGNDQRVRVFVGNDSTSGGLGDHTGWALTIGQVAYSGSGSVFLDLHVSDGQGLLDAGTLVNGIPLSQAEGVTASPTQFFAGRAAANTGSCLLRWEDSDRFKLLLLEDDTSSLWDELRFDVSGALSGPAGGEQALLTHGDGFDNLSLVAAVLVIPMNSEEGDPDPEVPNLYPPVIICGPGSVVYASSAPVSASLSAIVRDMDAGPLTVYWTLADGVPHFLGSDALRNYPGGTAVQLNWSFDGFQQGNHLVIVTVTDGARSQSCSIAVTVNIDSTPPVITGCPGPVSLTADESEVVALPDYTWQVTVSDGLTATQIPSAGTLLGVGVHTVALTATDAVGNTSAPCWITVTVVALPPDDPPPPPPPTVTCSVGSQTVAWSPNHGIADVGLAVTSTGSPVSATVEVYSDEDDLAPGSGKQFSPDARFDGDRLWVRAERRTGSGKGFDSGRVYLVVTTVRNATGQSATCLAAIGVPQDSSAKALASVEARRVAALAAFTAAGQVPAGFVLVGDGPEIGPKL